MLERTVEFIITSQNGKFLFAYWLCGLLLIIAFQSWLCMKTDSSRQKNLRRKWYHILALLLFVPGWFLNSSLLCLALAFVFALFIYLEIIRTKKMWPFSNPLNEFLSRFLEPKDESGPLLTSPIYLLLGCAIPIWLET